MPSRLMPSVLLLVEETAEKVSEALGAFTTSTAGPPVELTFAVVTVTPAALLTENAGVAPEVVVRVKLAKVTVPVVVAKDAPPAPEALEVTESKTLLPRLVPFRSSAFA